MKTLKPVITENTVLDVFNIEVQRAVEYLNSVKPDYKGLFSEVLDFYAGIECFRLYTHIFANFFLYLQIIVRRCSNEH